MSVTGVVLAYKRQIIQWANRGFQSQPAAGAPLPVEQLAAKLQAAQGQTPSAISGPILPRRWLSILAVNAHSSWMPTPARLLARSRHDCAPFSHKSRNYTAGWALLRKDEPPVAR
jgi:hypothetical protein